MNFYEAESFNDLNIYQRQLLIGKVVCLWMNRWVNEPRVEAIANELHIKQKVAGDVTEIIKKAYGNMPKETKEALG